jgi:hypothetical protein
VLQRETFEFVTHIRGATASRSLTLSVRLLC